MKKAETSLFQPSYFRLSLILAGASRHSDD